MRHNDPADGLDEANAIAVSPTLVFVTGQSEQQASGSDFGTVAYEATTGMKEWVSYYNGPGNDFDRANSVAVSPDGDRVFVTGESAGGATFDDYATVAYDAGTGAELWDKRYNGTANGIDSASSVEVSPDGARVFVTGNSSGTGTGNDFATVAYDAASGARQWVKRFNGPGNGLDWGRSVTVGADGTRVYVTGNSVESGYSDDYATAAYDAATGAKEWVSRYRGPGAGGVPTSVVVSPDGIMVFVTGWNEGAGTSTDFATIAYAA
jgi:WD40 repeat protein